jgi:uncharacterized membrane protein
MKPTTTVAVMTGPLMIDLWGVQVPALSMVLGLAAVIIVRVMLMSKEYRDDKSFWYYNISMTLLMALITFCVIADQKFGPGLSVMMGVGIGASGVVLVDLLKDRAQGVIKALIGKSDG